MFYLPRIFVYHSEEKLDINYLLKGKEACQPLGPSSGGGRQRHGAGRPQQLQRRPELRAAPGPQVGGRPRGVRPPRPPRVRGAAPGEGGPERFL